MKKSIHGTALLLFASVAALLFAFMSGCSFLFPKVTLSQSSIEIIVGDTFKLVADVDGEVEWSSSDEAVASVDGEGLVTGIAVGEAEITAAYGEFSAKCSVTVVADDEAGVPDNPVNPDNPDNPVNPDNPDNPDNPVNPDNPDNPVTPEYPENPVDPERILIWSDEFDGDSVDRTKWGYQNGDGSEYGIPGWGNNEQQYYREENSRVEDGMLKITAQITPEQDRGNYRGKKYTSSKLVTTGLFTTKYGRVEARIKLSTAEQGLWPAFWMMPEDSVYGGWPRSGEIDIMELRGRLPGESTSAIHYQTPGGHNWKGGTYTFEDSDITQFHTYAVEWTPEKIEFIVDGYVYCTITAETWHTSAMAENTSSAAPFDQEFFIILNMAVGGNFDNGREPADDKMPAEMWVDYVRVYAYEGGQN